MNIDRTVMGFAGSVILGSLLLGHFIHPGFLFITGFVGFMLLQSSITKLCPLVFILKKVFKLKPGKAFN